MSVIDFSLHVDAFVELPDEVRLKGSPRELEGYPLFPKKMSIRREATDRLLAAYFASMYDGEGSRWMAIRFFELWKLINQEITHSTTPPGFPALPRRSTELLAAFVALEHEGHLGVAGDNWFSANRLVWPTNKLIAEATGQVAPPSTGIDSQAAPAA